MKRFSLLVLALLLFSAQQTRVASDFEIAQMERQLATSPGFVAQLSARLNLGDLRLTRNENALATAEYAKAADLATRERLEARRAADMTRYATATSYAALAEAKLSHDARAFELGEEALRYASDSAKTWNLYASTMSLLHKTAKAASAARNAVAIASADAHTNPLDLAIYQYSLATFTDDEALLRTVVASLESSVFDPLKKSVVRNESFEVYSTTRGDEAAYVALLNRAQLRLGALYEKRGDVADARATYESVLAARSDDPTALAALARLAPDERRYAEAFDANPFSLALIREYQRYLDRAHPAAPDETTAGAEVRRALQQLHAGESRAARATLDALLARFPDNDTLRTLRREAEEHAAGAPAFLTSGKDTAQPTGAELRQLLGLTLTPEQRAALDRMTLAGVATFACASTTDERTTLASGTIDGVPFRFAEPTVFTGTFPANAPLRLTYRILGVTDVNGADGLLLEPLRVEAIR
jgi:tetratricopeptide (TPR) repeat protein